MRRIVFVFCALYVLAGCSTLPDMIQKGKRKQVMEIIRKNPERLEEANKYRTLAIHSAVKQDDYELVDLILYWSDIPEKMANANDHWPFTPLHYVKSKEVAQLLIEAGAAVNRTGFVGRTPLHTVVRDNPDPDLIAYLVGQGADVNARDMGGNTPLHSAVYRADAFGTFADNRLEVVKLFIEHGAVMAENGDGETPLDYAVKHGYDTIVAFLEQELPLYISPSVPLLPAPFEDTFEDGRAGWLHKYNTTGKVRIDGGREALVLRSEETAEDVLASSETAIPIDFEEDFTINISFVHNCSTYGPFFVIAWNGFMDGPAAGYRLGLDSYSGEYKIMPPQWKEEADTESEWKYNPTLEGKNGTKQTLTIKKKDKSIEYLVDGTTIESILAEPTSGGWFSFHLINGPQTLIVDDVSITYDKKTQENTIELNSDLLIEEFDDEEGSRRITQIPNGAQRTVEEGMYRVKRTRGAEDRLYWELPLADTESFLIESRIAVHQPSTVSFYWQTSDLGRDPSTGFFVSVSVNEDYSNIFSGGLNGSLLEGKTLSTYFPTPSWEYALPMSPMQHGAIYNIFGNAFGINIGEFLTLHIAAHDNTTKVYINGNYALSLPSFHREPGNFIGFSFGEMGDVSIDSLRVYGK